MGEMSCIKETEALQLLRQTLARIGDKWTFPILATLDKDRVRYNTLHRSIDGISHRMLTVNLRSLERDGLLTRTVHPTIPLRVEYALSDRGHTLKAALQPLAAWTLNHHKAIEESRWAFDRKRRWSGRCRA